MNSVKEVQIKDFSELTAMSDTDIFYIVSNGISYKISGSKIVSYIKDHPDLTNKYVLKVDIGTDVAPLNSGKKLDSAYIIFGKTENTVYNGADGAALEQSLSNHLSDITNPHKVTKEQVGLENVENKNSETIRGELTKQNVVDALGFEPEIDGAYEQATAYTDAKILELINGAPETLDTLKEVADAISEHSEIVDALNSAIGKKADQVELDTHTGNSTIHVTQTDKDNISTAISHANSAHARMDATKTEKSNINGNIKINDTETVVYEHPLSGVTAGTYRQITVDANGHVTGGNNTALPLTQGGTGATTAAQALSNLGLTATADEINKLDGITISTKEINYLDGVTSNIQTQLNGKALISHGNHVPDISSATSGNFLKSNGTTSEWGALTADEISTALGYVPGTGSNIVTAVKGDAETEYQTGEVNITPAKIGLGNVDNTHDNEKAVLSASKLTTSAGSSTQPVYFSEGKPIACTYTLGKSVPSNAVFTDTNNVAFGTCDTAAATAEKTVTISGNNNWSLTAGAVIFVKFTNTNTASGVTLNVNGTGAKNIWYNNADQTSTTTTNSNYYGYANRTLGYVYDGTYYVLFYWGYDANTTYSNATLGQGYGTCSTAAATTAKVVTLSSYTLTTGGIVSVKFTYAVPASATMNINSKGAKSIYYRGSAITAGIINAGDIATFIYNGSQYHLLSIDRWCTKEIVSSTEPTGQLTNDYWLKPL